MPNVIVLFEVTLKTGRMEDYLCLLYTSDAADEL